MRLPNAQKFLSGVNATALLVALVLMCVVGFAWYKVDVLDFTRAVNDLGEVYRQAKQVGYPLTASDITSPAHIGEAVDPLDKQFMQVMMKCAEVEFKAFPNHILPSQQLLRGPRFRTNLQTDTQKEVDLVTPFIDGAVKIALKQGDRFAQNKDWDLGAEVLFPEFSHHKRLIVLLGTRALLQAANADISGATQDIALGVKLASNLEKHPTLIGHLVMLAEYGILSKVATKCIEFQPKYAASFAELLKISELSDIRYALRGEAYLQLANIRNLGPDAPGPASQAPKRRSRTLREGLPEDRKSRAYLCISMRNWLPLIAACDLRQPFNKSLVFKEMANYDERQKNLAPDPINIFEAKLAPVMSGIVLGCEIRGARSYCVQVYAKAVKFFVDNGRPPNTLQEIKMSDRDPISGWPIKLRLTKNEMRVYNFGQDQEDNGGITSEEARLPGDDTTPFDDVYIYHFKARENIAKP
jgi:hypothetical protein